MYKQIIIARKDLEMTPGKLSAQVSHGSMAFLTSLIRDEKFMKPITKGMTRSLHDAPKEDDNEIIGYDFHCMFNKDIYEQWLNESFTKAVLAAKNKNHLLKAKTMAEELGLVEGRDFFLIYDACRTELEPEEPDGSTLTVIGFKPFDSEFIDKIGKKYQLYK